MRQMFVPLRLLNAARLRSIGGCFMGILAAICGFGGRPSTGVVGLPATGPPSGFNAALMAIILPFSSCM